MLATLYFLIRPVRIRNDAMSPTYPEGCVVFVTREWGIPERGEVVAIASQTGGKGTISIRRVVAIEGDSFPLSDSETVTVPEGYVLVQSDNREAATDVQNAVEGLVDVRLILGAVRFALGN